MSNTDKQLFDYLTDFLANYDQDIKDRDDVVRKWTREYIETHVAGHPDPSTLYNTVDGFRSVAEFALSKVGEMWEAMEKELQQVTQERDELKGELSHNQGTLETQKLILSKAMQERGRAIETLRHIIPFLRDRSHAKNKVQEFLTALNQQKP